MRFADGRRTAVILATGPSARDFDAASVERAGFPVIAVNDAYRIAGRAHAVYAADRRWWDHHAAEVRAVAASSELWTCDPAAARAHALRLVRYRRGPGLSRTAGEVAIGGRIGNSGAQAINLAYLWGARRLILCGFDMADQTHFFGDHPPALRTVSPWADMIAGMSAMASELAAEGVAVVNASPLTAIRYWPVVPLEVALRA